MAQRTKKALNTASPSEFEGVRVYGMKKYSQPVDYLQEYYSNSASFVQSRMKPGNPEAKNQDHGLASKYSAENVNYKYQKPLQNIRVRLHNDDGKERECVGSFWE